MSKICLLIGKYILPAVILFTLNNNGCASVVPIKFVEGLVPALPVTTGSCVASINKQRAENRRIDLFITIKF